jgi:hypothetical protein
MAGRLGNAQRVMVGEQLNDANPLFQGANNEIFFAGDGHDPLLFTLRDNRSLCDIVEGAIRLVKDFFDGWF